MLSTRLTNKGPLSGMSTYVIVQGCRARERSGAVAAAERFLAHMNDSMRAQPVGIREWLGAVTALEWLPRVLHADVHL